MAAKEDLSVLSLKRKPDFVESVSVAGVAERAFFYLKAGYPVHFSGPAGTGKTTLAMHVAALLGRPVMLIHGDDEFGSSDLIGGQLGYRSTKVVDNYIHSVIKKEENVSKTWVDNRLTTACKYGFTLIYDEFNRSRPEANNVLLSILEERLLELPSGKYGEGYLAVHPEFRAIFTSNPEEYAGVHKTQDALLDRMINLRMDEFDRETELGIVVAKSGLASADAARIVDIVRTARHVAGERHRPTVRACIMIGRLTALRQARVDRADKTFVQICKDVLCKDANRGDGDGAALDARIEEIITHTCQAARPRVAPGINGVNGHAEATVNASK
jgi:gas vesicle protein GvpN